MDMFSCGCGCTVRAHACGRQKTTSGVILWALGTVYLLLLLFNQCLSLTLNLPSREARLTSQETPGPFSASLVGGYKYTSPHLTGLFKYEF